VLPNAASTTNLQHQSKSHPKNQSLNPLPYATVNRPRILRTHEKHNAAPHGPPLTKFTETALMSAPSSPKRKKPPQEVRTWKCVAKTKRKSTASARCTRKRRFSRKNYARKLYDLTCGAYVSAHQLTFVVVEGEGGSRGDFQRIGAR
jgi:hypothetical protein